MRYAPALTLSFSYFCCSAPGNRLACLNVLSIAIPRFVWHSIVYISVATTAKYPLSPIPLPLAIHLKLFLYAACCLAVVADAAAAAASAVSLRLG